jgi:phosphatidylglycerophosphatase A
MLTHIIIFLASGAYTGFSPVASGTAGTLAGVLLYLLLPNNQPVIYLSLIILFICAAVWLASKGEIIFGAHDSGYIVIDEIVGFLVAMYLLPSSWGYILAVFLVFRAFDVLKPPPIRRMESLPAGLGVVLDDVLAGVYTNLVFQLWRLVSHSGG